MSQTSTTIWTTEKVNEALEKLRMGEFIDSTCFHEKDYELRAQNIFFQLTQEEEEEFVKCSQDIEYFVSKYCKFLTDYGRKTVKLRDFQSDILNTLAEEVWVDDLNDFGPKVRNYILMASRQTGKCFSPDTIIKIRDKKSNNIKEVPIYLLYNKLSKERNIFIKIKSLFYKLYSKSFINKIIKYILLFLIEKIEILEYSHIDLDEDDISKKIIESIELQDLEVETDSGFKSISSIHKTQPYKVWRIELENNMFLEGADNHILFDSLFNEVFIGDLRVNDFIQTIEGPKRIVNIVKYPFKISMFDVTVDDKNHRFYTNGILSHNTTTISAFFAWYLCFHTDRNLLIVANKQQTTIEIVDKVVQVFRGLPFFLKPGIRSIQALGLKLDNGCNLYSQSTTKTTSIGFTIHVLYIDEFAHIHPKIIKSFWKSVYPTLSSSKVSQCIISSTPNGMDNLFFEIWDKANKGINSFVCKRVDYWEVEGHDDKWANKMRADFGEEEFAQEFELSFDSKSNILLSGSELSWIKRISKDYVYHELEKTKLDDLIYRNKLLWHPDFDPNEDFDKSKYRFILSNDIAEGKDDGETKDNDFNVTSIFQVELKSLSKLKKLRKDEHKIENFFRIKQVGVFKDNIGDEENMAKVNKALIFDQFGEDICKLITEVNFNGKAFLKSIAEHNRWYEGIVMHSFHTSPIPGEKEPRKKPGFKTKSDKDFFCRLAKKLIRDKTLIITDKETLSEFGSFGKVKSTWKGIAKHDDLAMSAINVSRFYLESEYGDWLYDFLDEMEDSPEKRYAMNLLDEEPYDEEEISDDMFSALYLDDSKYEGEEEVVKNIFKNEDKSYNLNNGFYFK